MVDYTSSSDYNSSNDSDYTDSDDENTYNVSFLDREIVFNYYSEESIRRCEKGIECLFRSKCHFYHSDEEKKHFLQNKL